MKALFIENRNLKEIDLLDIKRDEAFSTLMMEYAIMESHVIYFSAGDARIKEIMISKEPLYSA
jgi:hypothetical protein